MAEASSDATILIAISWQALNRTLLNNKETLVCDYTVVILFAAFFIESNLNNIINELDKTEELLDFLYGKKRQSEKHPGLQDKLGWFYNYFIEKSQIKTRDQMYKNGITGKLREKFPGFNEIHKFRNDISHGKVDKTITNRNDAEKLRQQAKNIVDELFDIIANADYKIPRDKTYKDAITS